MDNKDIVQSVVCILAIDGKIEPQEQEFLDNLCERLNISPEVADEFLQQAMQGQRRMSIPEATGDRIKLFTMLVQAAACDGVISPPEQSALQAVAAKIGMSSSDVQHIIEAHLSTTSQTGTSPTQRLQETQSDIRDSPRHSESQKQPARSSSAHTLKWSYTKKILIGSVALLLLVGVSGWALSQSEYLIGKINAWIPGGETIITVSGPIPNPKPIDKLFTAFVYTPILDFHYDYKGTDIIGRLVDDVEKKVIKGYCIRTYDVGIGYDNVTELMEQYQTQACQGNIEKMPNPQILSTDTVESEIAGAYNRIDCDDFDTLLATGSRKSHARLEEDLKVNGQWSIIMMNSKKVLMGYLRIYCPEEDIR